MWNIMWGNPRLVTWDYNKEINLTLEDALISLESLRFMMGGKIHDSSTENVEVSMTAQGVVNDDGIKFIDPQTGNEITGITPAANTKIRWINLTAGTRGQEASVDTITGDAGDKIRIFWKEVRSATTASAVEVSISPSTFPGTYKIVGDTFMRSEETGKDHMFQFVIQKAKVLSDTTITLQADGDPSTFEMTIQVQRATNERGENEMMKLVRYEVI